MSSMSRAISGGLFFFALICVQVVIAMPYIEKSFHPTGISWWAALAACFIAAFLLAAFCCELLGVCQYWRKKRK